MRRTTPDKKPSIRERLEDAKRECAERKGPDKPAPQKKPHGAGRLMSRSKKWRLEWSFFLGENGRRQYNKLCKGYIHPCKQGFRAVVVSSAHTIFPAALKSAGIRVQNGRRNSLWRFFRVGAV